MTNRNKWFLAFIASCAILIAATIIFVLAYNFPWFADALDRAFGCGDLAPVEDFVKRIISALVWCPIFIRGLIDLIPTDEEEMAK